MNATDNASIRARAHTRIAELTAQRYTLTARHSELCDQAEQAVIDRTLFNGEAEREKIAVQLKDINNALDRLRKQMPALEQAAANDRAAAEAANESAAFGAVTNAANALHDQTATVAATQLAPTVAKYVEAVATARRAESNANHARRQAGETVLGFSRIDRASPRGTAALMHALETLLKVLEQRPALTVDESEQSMVA